LLLPGESVKHVHALARRIADAFESHEFGGAVTDITEHKLAEEALRVSEEQMRRSEGFLLQAQRLSHTGSWQHDLGAVTDSIPGLMCVMTATGEVDVVNQTFLDYAGMTPEELDTWQVVVHREGLQVDRRAVIPPALSGISPIGEISASQ
jgi:PAS domain-containing protein